MFGELQDFDNVEEWEKLRLQRYKWGSDHKEFYNLAKEY